MTEQPVIKTRSRRPDARPAEILSAALDLFSERGFSATRMADVASQAGLSKAAIYLYFKDKMALLQALVQTTVGANLLVARSMAEGHDGAVGDLLVKVMGFMAGRMGSTRMPDLVKLIISESRAHPEIGRFYLDNVVNQGLPFFETLIRRGIESGEFRAVDPRLAVKSMVAPVLLAAMWRSVFEPLGADKLDVEAFIRHSTECLVRGLRP